MSCAVSAYAQAQSQAQSQQSTQHPLLLAQTRPEALADVTVIDAETIARSGQTSLTQLLQLEHGIEMPTTGGPQSTTSLFMRGDNSTQYGSKVTGGFSYGYDIDKAWRATLGASTGFRAPTFNELYFPSFGQTSVRPESSKNIEAGLRYQANQTSASLTTYQSRVTDLIVSTTPCPVSGFGRSCAYNVNRAVPQGVGLSLMQGLGNTTLRADVDFQSPHDASTGNLLIRRAKQTAKLSAEHRLAAWVVGAEFLITSRRYDDTANTNALGGYSLANLFASYDIDKHWQGMLHLNNVFDKGYELARGYATPGANFFVQLSYRP
ncbi:MAG: TonB-dependent receptor [Candidatus Protistobacter heckmanni]|nr:TonB-dependent receptor [Candidatus Protistobacter heckmanni]